MINNISSGSGLLAFQNASGSMDRAADQIAKASVGIKIEGKPTDLVSPIVQLHSSSLDAKAAIRLLDVEEKTKGYLLDVMA